MAMAPDTTPDRRPARLDRDLGGDQQADLRRRSTQHPRASTAMRHRAGADRRAGGVLARNRGRAAHYRQDESQKNGAKGQPGTKIDNETIQRLYWAADALITRLSYEQKLKAKQRRA